MLQQGDHFFVHTGKTEDEKGFTIRYVKGALACSFRQDGGFYMVRSTLTLEIKSKFIH